MGGNVCMGGKCSTCWAGMFIVLGLVDLANAYSWFGLFGQIDWGVLVGIILVVKGVLQLIMPTCPHCKPESSSGTMAAKKKR